MSVHFSSDSDSWNTPKIVLDAVRRVAPIHFDPCGGEGDIVGALVSNRTEDGLALDWCAFGGLTYVNAPYSKIDKWIEKAAQSKCDIIALVPARTDTRWFQHCWDAQAICFWRGRLKFGDAKSSAPFPSAVVMWGDAHKFEEAFTPHGKVVML